MQSPVLRRAKRGSIGVGNPHCKIEHKIYRQLRYDSLQLTPKLRCSLEQSNPLLENVSGGVLKARVDVAELSKGEEIGGMVRVLELEGGSAVNGNGAGASGGIGDVAAVQAEGVET